MSINTSTAWDSIKTYLANFTHGLEAELKHIEQALGLTAKIEAPKPVTPKSVDPAPVAEVAPATEAPKA